MKAIIVLILLTFSSASLWAQPLAWMGKPKPYKWLVGVSWNAVEDDGRGFCQMFDVTQSWNMPAYPTRLVVDRYFKHGLSAEFSGAYNRYLAGKLINDSTNRSGMFLSFDLNAKYSFYDLQQTTWLDPYVSLGVGITQRTAIPQVLCPTANIGAGVNIWIYKGLGIQLQTSAKFGLAGKLFAENDYFQHSAGIVYKFKGDRKSNEFNKKHYKWTDKKQRYKSGRKKG